MAVGQNQCYLFGRGAPPILVYFSGDWDVHWGYDLDLDHWTYCKAPDVSPYESLGYVKGTAFWFGEL